MGVKGALDPLVAEKAVFLGASPAGCRYPPTLSEYIDLSTMPRGSMYDMDKPRALAKFTRSTIAAALSEREQPLPTMEEADGNKPVPDIMEAVTGGSVSSEESESADERWRGLQSRNLGRKHRATRARACFGCFMKKDRDE